MKMQQPTWISLFWLTLCLLPRSAISQCPETVIDDEAAWWTQYGQSCYRWFNATLPWFPAEAACRALGGHLASIWSDQENRLVGRLSGCQYTWIGRFLAEYRRSAEPDGYEWTSGRAVGESAARYSRHNFSQMTDPHMGAVVASVLVWHNAHYHEMHPYVCEVPAKSVDGVGERCPSPFAQFRNSCYWLSDFPASFVEAGLYCERELHCHLASVQNREELAFIGTLQLDADTCEPSTVWVGLIRQSPCRPAKDGGPAELCYQWTDLSGEHMGYPEWAPGHPLRDDWTVNCASLAGERLLSEKCHVRRRFVCEAPAKKVAT